jgi:hypothetical protein
MPKTATISLEDRIIAALMDTNCSLWFPHLTHDLVQTGWQRLEEIGITESDYGTARVILSNVNEARDIAFSLLIPNQSKEIKNLIPIEILPQHISSQYKKSGVHFYRAEELLNKGIADNEILNCIRDAFNIIREVPSLFSTVISLVKSIHLIKAKSNEYDISFSEPKIPFSIFISIPQNNYEINALRVAEAIVHEAMHLQLTLIERTISLVINNSKKFYSPWKSEYRTADGVLHALYVFQVINKFLAELLSKDQYFSQQRIYINKRQKKITDQITQIQTFVNCPNLTNVGSFFVQHLIASQ